MMLRPTLFRPRIIRTALSVGVLLAPIAAMAQPHAGDGFMFGAPGGSITVRAGYARPSEGSDVFAFVQKELTLSHGAFSGGSASTDVAFFFRPRLALQLGVGYASRTVSSVYRQWVDNANHEIEQQTALQRMPLSIGLRYYLTPPGRELGRLAWVPSKVTTYVAGGGGITWYKFRQFGDFVDYKTLDVFPSVLESNAWAPGAFGATGVEYALSARVGVTAEARYDVARARMGNDFSGFNNIDVSGAAVTVGMTLRF